MVDNYSKGVTFSFNFLQNTESKTRPNTYEQVFKDGRESNLQDPKMNLINKFSMTGPTEQSKKISFTELVMDHKDSLLQSFKFKDD